LPAKTRRQLLLFFAPHLTNTAQMGYIINEVIRMYQVLENRKRMTREEIRQEFDGKWVYLVDLEGELGSPFETAVVAVVADDMWEGSETGIYHDLRDKHERALNFSLLKNEWNVFGFNEVVYDE